MKSSSENAMWIIMRDPKMLERIGTFTGESYSGVGEPPLPCETFLRRIERVTDDMTDVDKIKVAKHFMEGEARQTSDEDGIWKIKSWDVL